MDTLFITFGVLILVGVVYFLFFRRNTTSETVSTPVQSSTTTPSVQPSSQPSVEVPDLSTMTKNELLEFARGNGVEEVNSRMRKAEILDAVNSTLQSH